MEVKLYHNQILKGTVTEAFKLSVMGSLLPMLKEKHSDLSQIYMYEDHISRGLMHDGEWYYPFTVVAGGEPFIEWVSWKVDKADFDSGIPYSLNDGAEVSFTLANRVPAEFKDYMKGRRIYFDKEFMPFSICSASKDKLFLSGKYSQGFVDELAFQITEAISKAMSVDGLHSSEVELQLVFDGATYMEHTSENVTYRRLLISDNTGRARDFWVKWTRLDGALSFTVTDSVNSDNVRFELGEDVSQKIREKEYRFLCRIDPDKYQSSMGKKTVTEWREVIKRCIRRGTLIKVEREPEISEHAEILSNKLAEILLANGVKLPTSDNEIVEENSYTPSIVVDEEPEPVEEITEPIEEVGEENEQFLDEEYVSVDAIPEEESEEIPDEDEPREISLVEEAEGTAEIEEQPLADEEPIDIFKNLEQESEKPAPTDSLDSDLREKIREEELKRIREEEMRAKVEAEIRLEYESRARAKAEADLVSLKADLERLLAENERLARINKEREERFALDEEKRREEAERVREANERAAKEEQARAEEERVRREALEEQLRSEERERERLSLLARAAVEEQRRIERERAEREEAAREETLRLERERAIREEAERERERERLERERAIEEQRRAKEEEERFVTKHAKLFFRNTVDLNVMKRIQEIVEETLVANNKEHVHIHMKAYPSDANTINLEIIKMPRSENELLVSIIKAIGNGKLGISRITLE